MAQTRSEDCAQTRRCNSTRHLLPRPSTGQYKTLQPAYWGINLLPLAANHDRIMKDVINEGSEFGLVSGYSIPVRTSQINEFGGFSVFSDVENRTFLKRLVPIEKLIAS